MISARYLPLLIVFLLPALCLPAQSPVVQAPSQPSLQFATSLGEDLYRQSGSVGMVLVVVQGDQVFFHGYGETAPGSHLPPTQDSLLRLCSLTKIFTTDVLAKLVADHTVRLDDPLQRYAPRSLDSSSLDSRSPESRKPIAVPKRIQPITLADLATHTSGLPRELGTAPRGTPHFTFPDYRTRWRWLPNQRLRTTPGTAALYSNVGFDLLSDALQSAAHKQYAAILAERTLNPLHMQHTTFFPNAAQCSQLLLSADDQGPCTSTEESAGSSGLYSTAADMTLWLKYLLGTDAANLPAPNLPIQDPAAQAVYIAPSHLVSQKGLDHAGEPTGVGLGWIHILPLDEPSHIVEKTGGGAGFRTYIAINHARRTAIFLAATDGPTPTHVNLFNAANKFLLAVAGLPPLPPPPPKPVPKHKHPHRRR